MVVEGGEDILVGYEIEFESDDEKEYEIMVAPDGEILEEPSDVEFTPEEPSGED
jgi:hypothetical protein